MKINRRLIIKFVLYISVSLLFIVLSNSDVSYAVTVSDVYTGVFADGKADNPKPWRADKPVIRPIYNGNSETILQDVTLNGANFVGFGWANRKPYVKGTVILYTNVGVYNGRKLTLSITLLRPFYLNGGFQAYLTDSWGMRMEQIYTDSAETIKYQLVYDDTKEPVKDILLEIPIKDIPDWGKAVTWRKIYYNLDNLEHVYIRYRNLNLKTSTISIGLDEFDKTATKQKLIVSPSASDFNSEPPDEYGTVLQAVPTIVITDNNVPTIVGIRASWKASQTFFDNSYSLPHLPYYLAPDGTDSTTKDGKFMSEYEVYQDVIEAMDPFYPDVFSIYFEDEKKYFTNFDSNNFVVKDKDDKDITKLLSYTKISENKFKVDIPTSVLSSLKNNSLKFIYSSSEYDKSKLSSAYDASKNAFVFPITAYNYYKKDGLESTSKKSTINSIVPVILSATAVDQRVSLNSSTDDLDLTKVLKDPVSNIPDDQVKLSLDSPEKRFTKVGTESIAVKVSSSKIPSITKSYTIKVNVVDDLVTSSFFENQSWIINELNKQLSPKKIDVNMYFSDLVKITKINLTNISGNQYIPRSISGLINLNELSLTGKSAQNSGLVGTIPKEMGRLSELMILDLSDNKLEGTLPDELNNLKKLTVFNVSKNIFFGQLPTFSTVIDSFNVSETELTYNTNSLPAFISPKNGLTKDSFVYNARDRYLQLISPEVKIYNEHLTEIKPFDPSERSKFELGAKVYKSGAALSEVDKPKKLLEGHIFTIRDAVSNKLYYEGKADPNISIPYSKGIIYKVIMDNAESNPNSTIQITTKVQKQKVTVKFVDETDEALHEPITFEGIIGTKLNLTQESNVQKVLKDLVGKNYQIKQTPEPENAVKIQEKESTVTYQFEGTLFVYSKPNILSFGLQTLRKGHRFIRVEKAHFDQSLIIWDNRKKSNSWTISATLEKPLTSVTDPNYTLPDAIKYKRSETDTLPLLTGNAVELAKKTSNGSNKYNVSNEWKAGKSGFQLEVPTGKVIQPGGYRATILWQVGDTP